MSFAELRERRLDLLGDLAEEHLDLDALLDLAQSGLPAGLSAGLPGALPDPFRLIARAADFQS